jgi:hypothetical protein
MSQLVVAEALASITNPIEARERRANSSDALQLTPIHWYAGLAEAEPF